MERVVAVALLATMAWASASCRALTEHPSADQDAGTGEPSSRYPPEPPPLVALEVSPSEQTVQLSLQADGTVAPTTATFTAIGWFEDQSEMDLTIKVSWTSDPSGVTVVGGVATVTAPGSFTVTAQSGAIQGSATLTATP
jgi:hypothetical protein